MHDGRPWTVLGIDDTGLLMHTDKDVVFVAPEDWDTLAPESSPAGGATPKRVRRGRPRLDGHLRGVRTSITLPQWVRDELQRSGGLATTAREVLSRWAARERTGEEPPASYAAPFSKVWPA